MNTKYAKLINGHLTYAPKSLETSSGVTLNPSEASYLAAGWKRVIDERPTAGANERVEISGWTEGDTTLTCVYKLVAAPSTSTSTTSTSSTPTTPNAPATTGPRIFSKLKIVVALKAANLWVLTKTWIEENGLYDYYLAAQDFSENNEWFIRGRVELQQLANKTDAEVEAILAACVAD